MFGNLFLFFIRFLQIEEHENMQIGDHEEEGAKEEEYEECDFWEELGQKDALLSTIQTAGTSFVTYLHSLTSYNRSMVHELVKLIENRLLNPITDAICDKIKASIPAENQKMVLNSIKKATATFDVVSTEYKLVKYLKEKKIFNPPTLDEIDSYLEPKNDIDGASVQIVEKSIANVYIGLENFFKKFCGVEENLRFMLEYMDKLNSSPDTCIDNFIKGVFWNLKIRNFEGKICIPYFLFADSFEVNNPIGSKTGKHALTGN